MEGKAVRRYIFLGLFILLFILVARLFSPFLTVIIWSGLLYAFLNPLYNRLSGNSRGRPLPEPWRSMFAAIFAVVSVLIILVPIILLGIALIGQLRDVTRMILRALAANPAILDLSPAGPIGKFIYDITQGGIDLSNVNLRQEFSHLINGSTAQIINVSSVIVRDALVVVVGLLFIMFTFFFFLLDGPELLGTIIGALPIEREYSMLFLRTLRSSSRDLVVGYMLVSLFQGVVAFALFSAFGIKGALVFGALTVGASFIPMLGTSLIWGPLSIAMILGGDMRTGFLLLGLSAVLIAGLDNVLRVYLLRDRLKVHPLLIFFAIVGGLETFGFNGLILGPLILMAFFTGVKLYDKVTDRALGDHGKSDIED